MEKFIMAGGVATRCTDIGKGDKVVVLIHGYLESLDVWDAFAGQLGRAYRVIGVDLPGSGMSDWGAREVIGIDFMASVVSDVMSYLGVDRATIVGHSMGGYVAVAMAELYPSRVERLVLFHSSPSGDNDDKKAHRQREIDIVASGKKELLASINPARGFAPQNVRRCAETIEELAEQVMLTDDDAIIATLKGMSERVDRSDFFNTFAATTPSLIIFGAYDPYIPQEAREAMIARYTAAQTALLEASAHMGFVEEPAACLEILSNFIEKTI